MKNTVIGLVATRIQRTDARRGNWSKPGPAGTDIHVGSDTLSGPDGSSSHWTHGAIIPVTTNATVRTRTSTRARNVLGMVSSLPAPIAAAGSAAASRGTDA